MIRAAVLGKPVHHSLSPLVHGLIYRELGLEHHYGTFEVDEAEAMKLIEESFSDPKVQWNGFSLTMPLKEVGFSLPLAIDSRAFEARSINTITPGGSFNTDISGLERVLRVEGIESKSAIVLGSGATARSTLIALDSLHSVEQVTLFRRSDHRDAELPLKRRVPVSVKPFSDLSEAVLGRESLIVSTLPGGSQIEISKALSGFSGTLVDFSYSPWPSRLAVVVKGVVISGLSILVSQAVDQAKIFSGADFDADEMYRKVLLSTIESLADSG
jgi:shikimate dehydrogenase